jgi:hypothetical protein
VIAKNKVYSAEAKAGTLEKKLDDPEEHKVFMVEVDKDDEAWAQRPGNAGHAVTVSKRNTSSCDESTGVFFPTDVWQLEEKHKLLDEEKETAFKDGITKWGKWMYGRTDSLAIGAWVFRGKAELEVARSTNIADEEEDITVSDRAFSDAAKKIKLTTASTEGETVKSSGSKMCDTDIDATWRAEILCS